MRFYRDKHHRCSIRLNGYNYAHCGAYFVPMCAYNRECLFGGIVEGVMQINEYGEIVRDEWRRTEDVRSNVEVDEFIIMPNHLHAILIINDNDNDFDVGARRCLARCTVNAENRATHRVAPTTLQSDSLGSIIGQFKSIVTKQINISRNHPGMPVWQRYYYEHIIRNETEMDRIRQYIINNPSQWENDENNPANYRKVD